MTSPRVMAQKDRSIIRDIASTPSQSSRFSIRLLTLLLGSLTGALAGCDVSNDPSQKTTYPDPLVVDHPIAYIERPLPVDNAGNAAPLDITNPIATHLGARLILKARATASAVEKVIVGTQYDANGNPTSLYDIKDLAVSYDGTKLLFSMRGPLRPGFNENNPPTWTLWEYDYSSDQLAPLIKEPLFVEAGHDVQGQYLPDGRVVFASTRQVGTRALLLDEARPQYSPQNDKLNRQALALHIYQRTRLGEERIEQISYNVSNDLYPTVLNNGQLLFLRHDGFGGQDRLSLYRSNLDGSDPHPYYGYHSQNTGTEESVGVFSRPHQLEDGRILANLVPRTTVRLGGLPIAIDGERYVDLLQPTYANTGLSGEGQESLIHQTVDMRGIAPSVGGYFSSAAPLYDGSGRLIVSWTQCRLLHPETQALTPCTEDLLAQGAEQAPPLYGIWIYDPLTGTQLPVKVPSENVMVTDAIVITRRHYPPTWTPPERAADLVASEMAVLNIRSIYDVDGRDMAPGGLDEAMDPLQTPTDQRTQRFIRIIKNVAIPTNEELEFERALIGLNRSQGMREIVGYVPIEPDGSARFVVPANTPLSLEMVNAQGKRVGNRHQNWLYLRPGEERHCTGCHTSQSAAAHGRRDAEAPSIHPGATLRRFPNTLLRDQNGIPHIGPTDGKSMAEYYTEIYEQPRIPSLDLTFTDEWTDPYIATPGADIQLRYIDIETTLHRNPRDANCAPLEIEPPQWQSPARTITTSSGIVKTRTSIHYRQSIHPLWEADRRSCDENGNVLQDATCTSCHSRGSADAIRVPAGQLELTGNPSEDVAAYITSYVELLRRDDQQEVVENSLVDRTEERLTGEYETDAEGNLLLDENEQPIPIIEIVKFPVAASMSASGAEASRPFFRRFEQWNNDTDSVNHVGFLSPAELKLIAEWLDIGAQYYNDPFEAATAEQ